MADAVVDAARYPVGRFKAGPPGSAADRAVWIGQIAETPQVLARLVDGLTPAEMLNRYRDGGWTIAQVVHHVADSHMNAYIRTRFAVAESNFTVKPYDEQRWSEFPDASDPDVGPSLRILRGLHTRWVTLLRSLTADDFARELLHPERGPMTVDSLVQLYAWHGRHHAAHVEQARTRAGSPGR